MMEGFISAAEVVCVDLQEEAIVVYLETTNHSDTRDLGRTLNQFVMDCEDC
jgi:hypothetical protein